MTKIIQNVNNYVVIPSLEAVSHLSMGQILLKFIDRCVGIIEKTAQWSFPYPPDEISAEENGKSFKEMQLVRPLPWILFLPSLLILRGFRVAWNIGAYVIGYPEIHPNEIVRTMQKIRQRLRSIRISGGKKMRKNKIQSVRDKTLRINDAKRSLIKSIKMTLSSLSCFDASRMKCPPSPISTVHVYSNNNDINSATPDEKSATESTIMSTRYSKRKYSSVSSDDQSSEETDNEPLMSKIDRYALMNSFEDDDFDPAEYSSRSDATDDDIELNDEAEVCALISEANENREEIMKMCRNELPSDPIQIIQQFIQNEREKYSSGYLNAPQSDEQAFYTPKSTEGDAAGFYSPISSKSTSPEPDKNDCEIVNVINGKTALNNSGDDIKSSAHENQLLENGESKTNLLDGHPVVEDENIIDELKTIMENTSDLPTAGKEKQANHYQKGKRNNYSNQGNRKRK